MLTRSRSNNKFTSIDAVTAQTFNKTREVACDYKTDILTLDNHLFLNHKICRIVLEK